MCYVCCVCGVGGVGGVGGVCVSVCFLTLASDIENYPSKKDRFLVRTSYMEIYNEKLSDLMVRSTS